MYELKEISLKNKHFEKKRLIIQFHETRYAILAEFLMSDVHLLKNELHLALKQIENGAKDVENLTGNRCALLIQKKVTEISDLLIDMDEEAYESLTLSTKEFEAFIDMWQQELDTFNQKNK